MTDHTRLSAFEIVQRVGGGEVTAEEVVNQHLAVVRKQNEEIGALLEVLGDSAVSQAQAVDARRKKGEVLGALAGVPIVVKDNICVRGVRTTCASRILEGFVAPYDATVIARLKSAGAVIIGKSNLDEFAMGSSTENSAYWTTKNPWNVKHVPGGSSGGSAASVAAGMSPMALGSDTGGSIRQPAAFCGVVGFKPTYGTVSRYGLVAFASSLDQIGPLTRDVRDAALLMSVVAGHDERDATSLAQGSVNYLKILNGKEPDLKGVRIGLPREYFTEGLDGEVASSVQEAVKTLEGLGARVLDVSLPHTEYGIATYYIVAPSEASANLARYDGVRFGKRVPGGDLVEEYEKTRGEGFGPEVRRRIMLGTYSLSSGYYDAYYLRALKVRTLIARDFEEVFKKVDVLVTPTTPTPAFAIGEKTSDPLQMYLSDIFTISCSLTGLPGISVPCGLSAKGLPIGLQIMGKALDDAAVLHVGHKFLEATNWQKMVQRVAPASTS